MHEPDCDAPGAQIVYLCISGVLHPSRMLYELLHERTPEEDGHRRYEAVDALNSALSGWPKAKIILSSPQPWVRGLEEVLQHLGPLASRVDGYTFEDLTTKIPFGKRRHPISSEDYWRLSKGSVVLRHVSWLTPARWIALDDDADGWPDDIAEQHLVLTQVDKGLLAPESMDRLLTVLQGNFGPPVAPAATLESDSGTLKGADQLRTLETIAVHHTPLGIGYVLFADLDEPAMEACWGYAAKRRGLLRLPSGEDAVFFEDYKLWIKSLGGACPEE